MLGGLTENSSVRQLVQKATVLNMTIFNSINHTKATDNISTKLVLCS